MESFMDIGFSTFQTMINNAKTETGVVARFYDRAVQTGEISESGLPVFKEVMYVEIRVRDQNDVFDQPADENHIKRFPIEYNRYLLEKKESEKGTPLAQFAFLTVSQLECCKYRGIFTVERLADLEDSKARDVGLVKEKELAIKFLEVSKNNAVINDFSKKEKKYQAEIKKLKSEIEQLKAAANE